ncbi:MAG: YidB family protein [Methylobacter sp.]
MSLFTEIVKSAIGAHDASGQVENKTQNLVNGALAMLEKMGGVDGLVKKFQQSGMGDQASSWVGTGENKSIKPDQLTQVLGNEQISDIARQADIPESQGASVLSRILPVMVDKLTPEGKAPESSNLATWSKVLLGAAGAAVVGKAAASYFGNKEDEGKAPVSEQQTTNTDIAETGTGTPTTAARTYTVTSGDTLSKIAKHFYNDGNEWQRIFNANRDILSNPDRIAPGQHLRIP